MQGLAREVGAAIGGVVLDHGYHPSAKNAIAAATLSGFDAGSFGVFDAHRTHGSVFNPLHREIMRRLPTSKARVFTLRDDEICASRAWDAAPWVAEYVRPAHLNHVICSAKVLDMRRGHAEGMGFVRELHDRCFSDEDASLVDVVCSETPRLFGEQPVKAPVKLAPRVQATLDHLLTGASDKEIAQRMDLSTHTVREYVKTIFRAYCVTSRGQLIAQRAGRR